MAGLLWELKKQVKSGCIHQGKISSSDNFAIKGPIMNRPFILKVFIEGLESARNYCINMDKSGEHLVVGEGDRSERVC